MMSQLLFGENLWNSVSVVALSGWLCLHVHCSHYSVYFMTLNSNCVALLADNIHTKSY